MTQHYDCAGSVKEVMLNFTISLWDSLSQNARTFHRLKTRVVHSGKKSPARATKHESKNSTSRTP